MQKNKPSTRVYVILISIFLASCASLLPPKPTKEQPNSTAGLSNAERAKYSQAFGYPVSPSANPALLATVKDWLGTPYLFAGNTTAGADCSGFVQQVYLKVYDKPTARTADGMAAQSQSISKSNLKEGDMVFFKIETPKVGHVGIYLQDGYFVHASSSRGVIVSNLSEAYYTKYFVGGGRL